MMLLRRALLAVATAVLALSPATDALWPVPKRLSSGNKALFIDQTVEVTYNGESVRWHSPNSDPEDDAVRIAETDVVDQQISYTAGYVPPGGPRFNSRDIVRGGISRTFEAIFQRGFVPWMLRPRGSDFEPGLAANHPRTRTLQITQTKKDDRTFRPVAGTVDESYSLNVTLDGHASVRAASSTGVLRALETFSQFFFRHSSGTAWYTQLVPVSIDDAPRFPHRRLLLDVARHWFEVSDIERTIDALAMNKMNVLHLHMTETQSWPLDIPALPLLAEKGAYHSGLTYSPKVIADLQAYGVHRGVQVILEIDMPGHVGVEKAYPGLSVAYNAKPWQWYCAQPPCGSFRLNNTDVERFLDKLFEDLLPRLSPYSAYFHTGGDEYKANNSLLDPALETNNATILQPLLQRFLDHTHDKIRQLGLIPMVWEEMILDWNATVGKDVVVQTWLGRDALQKLAETVHRVIDSNNNFYYLSCGRGEWLDFGNGPAFQDNYPFLDWCDPTENWKLMYSHDPTDGLSENAAKNVIGGEMAVWTEVIDATSLDTIVWSRASAANEFWWSGRVINENGANRSKYHVRPRLSEMRERMLARGVRGGPIT